MELQEHAIEPFSQGIRPSLLTGLCVVIFIFCGWSLIGNIMEAYSPTDPEVQLEQMNESFERFGSMASSEDEEGLAKVRSGMEIMINNTVPIALIKALSAALALVGAYMMWKLRKSGFHLYVIAGILWSFAPMFLIGANIVSWAFAISYGLVCLVFTLLFASQLKYMH